MAYTTIDDPSAHHQAVLYTGGGNGSSVTFDGNSDLQVDWLWVKRRDSANNSKVFDTSRGMGSGDEPYFTTISAEKEQTYGYITSVNSDGFTWDNVDNSVGTSSNTYVAWGWKANGGTRTTFTESSNNPGGGHQANTTAGFSIVDYTGTGGNGTVSHGLGVKPTMMIIKNRDQDDDWVVYVESLGNTKAMFLNNTDPVYTLTDLFNSTTPTSSVFTVGTNDRTNADGEEYIAYCFAPIQGYSKFGSYTGNGDADGTFIYTGFKPAFVLTMDTDTSNKNRYQFDIARNPFNVHDDLIAPNLNNAEDSGTGTYLDFLSDGFKMRQDFSHMNASGSAQIYWAFAHSPFVSSKGVPTTAV